MAKEVHFERNIFSNISIPLQCKATKETNAINVTLLEKKNPGHRASSSSQKASSISSESNDSSSNSGSSSKKEQQQQQQRVELVDQKGYVAAIKDGFGFLETQQHDKEIFFHFSNLNGNPVRKCFQLVDVLLKDLFESY